MRYMIAIAYVMKQAARKISALAATRSSATVSIFGVVFGEVAIEGGRRQRSKNGSQRTAVVTELAMKHSACAL